jgi:hypothetical protein
MTDDHQDKVAEFRFRPERRGLKVELMKAYSPSGQPINPDPLEEGEHSRHLSVTVDASEHHGILMFPIRLPRFLMPEWRQEEWKYFLERQLHYIEGTLDECAVQCLSLAIVSDQDRRKKALEGASDVVIDFRGDLPNYYSPIMMGGYKIGVYGRSNWPIWTAIAPTYDLALEEAAKLREELKIPNLPGRTVPAGVLLFKRSTRACGSALPLDKLGCLRGSGAFDCLHMQPRSRRGDRMVLGSMASIGIIRARCPAGADLGSPGR